MQPRHATPMRDAFALRLPDPPSPDGVRRMRPPGSLGAYDTQTHSVGWLPPESRKPPIQRSSVLDRHFPDERAQPVASTNPSDISQMDGAKLPFRTVHSRPGTLW